VNINEFWKIVDQFKDEERPELAVAELLETLPAEEVMQFGYYLEWMEIHASRADIWCAAYLLNGGCSDDEFSYFIRGLIAKGRALYDATLKNPDNLEVLWGKGDIENESFGWVAREVYARKMGIDVCNALDLIGEKVGSTHFDLYIDGALYVTPEMEDCDFEDEIENRKRLPKLSNLFYEYWKDKPAQDVRWPETLTARTQ
jgi:hypothetical protein